jgi:hypothetical protein
MYYSFHDVIAVVKSAIFKLKTININIFFKNVVTCNFFCT